MGIDPMTWQHAQRRQELSDLSDEELADMMESYLKNAFGLRRVAELHLDSPTYDSALFYQIIPEAIDRLKEKNMGYYIEAPRNHRKAEWLEEVVPEAEIVNKQEAWEALLEGHGVICVVDNGPFEAAGFCFSKDEFSQFAFPDDPRPKKWVKMPRSFAERLSGFKGMEARQKAYDQIMGVSDE